MREQWQYDSPMRYGRGSPQDGVAGAAVRYDHHIPERPSPYEEPISSYEGPMPMGMQYAGYVPEGPSMWHDQHDPNPPARYEPPSIDEHDRQRPIEYAENEYWSPTSTYNRQPPH